MTKVEYKYISTEEVIENKYPNIYISRSDTLENISYQTEFRTHLYRFEDGKAVEHIGSDGGEPEDQTFYRDLDWIAGCLQSAYELGKKHATS